jgi:CRISPR system Cascade subunit CasB
MTETMLQKRREERFAEYVEYLKELERNEDRAALAALRRSLGKSPGEAAEAHRYILPFNPTTWEESAYYLVGGLFALHPQSWRRDAGDRSWTNLGASFARLRSQVDSKSIEKRFVALLNCHEDDLAEHLRHAIGLLRSKEIPIDWVELLKDLCNWNHEDRFVQLNWARAFWGRADEQTQTNITS